MFTLFVIVHVIVSVILIMVVLLQSGKAGDLASAFGGVGSQTAFGARGAATFLSKATTICAILFMISSLGLSLLFTRPSSSTVMEKVPAETAQPGSTPATPSTPSEKTPGTAPAQNAPQK